MYEIAYNNLYWQETSSSNGTVYLIGAYYDTREKNRFFRHDDLVLTC